MSKFTVAGALCGIFLSTYCTAREFTPCQIADSSIRATISSDEVITIRGKVSPTMHSGVFLHDYACDAHSIKLVSLSNDKSVSVAVDAIITEECTVTRALPWQLVASTVSVQAKRWRRRR